MSTFIISTPLARPLRSRRPARWSKRTLPAQGYVSQEGDSWSYTLPVPGASEDELEVSLEAGLLRIEHRPQAPEESESWRAVRRERAWPHQAQHIPLPRNIIGTSLRARLTGGLLVVEGTRMSGEVNIPVEAA